MSTHHIVQVCTQGFPVASEMPSNGVAGTAIFKYQVLLASVRKECEAVFEPELLPPLRIPKALSEETFASKLKAVGGVVFTNGDIDEWAGGETKQLYVFAAVRCWDKGDRGTLLL